MNVRSAESGILLHIQEMNPKFVWLLIALGYALFCVSLALGGDKTFDQKKSELEETKLTALVERAAAIGRVVADHTRIHYSIDRVKWYPRANAWAFICSYEKWNWAVLIYPTVLANEDAIAETFMQAETDQIVFWQFYKMDDSDKDKPKVPNYKEDEEESE